MKKIIWVLLFGFICVANGVFAQDNQMNKFEGTWQWKSHDSIFTIVLKKVEFNGKKFNKDMPDITVNLLIGWHELTVKGVVISSSMDTKSETYNYKKMDFTLRATVNQIIDNGKSINFDFGNPYIKMDYVLFSILPNGDAQINTQKIPNVAQGIVVLKKIK